MSARPDAHREPPEPSEKARLEAFSDGVFAIAITLLVLEIKVPHPQELGAGGLSRALVERWPSYLAYLIAFATIGIMWANHHGLTRLVRRVDHWLLLATVVFLMTVSFLPFPTAVLADFLAEGASADRTTAAAFWGWTFVAISLGFNVWWRTAVWRGLLHDPDAPAVRAISRSFLIGPLGYLAATLLAYASVTASVVAYAVLALYWALAPVRQQASGG